jgi:hypothetical protein
MLEITTTHCHPRLGQGTWSFPVLTNYHQIPVYTGMTEQRNRSPPEFILVPAFAGINCSRDGDDREELGMTKNL